MVSDKQIFCNLQKIKFTGMQTDNIYIQQLKEKTITLEN